MTYWDLAAQYIRTKHGLPDDWAISSMNCGTDACPPGWVKVEGGRYALLTRGERKGKPNWRKPLGKEQVFFVALADINALQASEEV